LAINGHNINGHYHISFAFLCRQIFATLRCHCHIFAIIDAHAIIDAAMPALMLYAGLRH